jgi:hypothetical protein
VVARPLRIESHPLGGGHYPESRMFHLSSDPREPSQPGWADVAASVASKDSAVAPRVPGLAL